MHGPLRESDLLPAGPLRRLGSRVFLLDEVESTNEHLLRLADTLPDGAIASAEYQSAGRGRQGRRWVAPRGSSLLISVLLIERGASPTTSIAGAPERRVTIEPLATTLAAVAACEAVDAMTDCRPELRWPNDLVLKGRKLGGVLAEARSVAAGRRAVAIGVGLNCLQQTGHFPGDLAAKATSLELSSTRPIDRRRLATAFLAGLDSWLVMIAGRADGVIRLRDAWRQRCGDVGRHVTLFHDGATHAGTVLDISDAGDLDVQLDLGGRRRFGAATTTRYW